MARPRNGTMGSPWVRHADLCLRIAITSVFLQLQESLITPDRSLTHVKVIHGPGTHRGALRGRMREPGRISEQSSIQCDADGSGPRTIRDELSTGHPGDYFARSRAARPPRALGEWDPTGRIHDRRHR